jgi:hypothetical protein
MDTAHAFRCSNGYGLYARTHESRPDCHAQGGNAHRVDMAGRSAALIWPDDRASFYMGFVDAAAVRRFIDETGPREIAVLGTSVEDEKALQAILWRTEDAAVH